ncbi:MAG: hypothetical protein U1E51_22985 [Candidatus Binatia bacterium]|nr:hypothetical protein [Candidatus Binatia bacterium]
MAEPAVVVAAEAAEPSQSSLGSLFGGVSDDTPKEPVTAEATSQEEKSATEVKETKPETSPAVEAKPEEKPTLAKEEAKPKEGAEPVVEVKKEEPSKPVVNWDTDENPYKKRHKDAGDYANRVNRENLELKRQFEVINKKLDGTYDPAVDDVKAPAPEEVMSNGQLIGRVGASLTAAIEIYGEETVNREINEFHQTFGQNPIIQQRVKSADLPAVEALKVMKEYRFVKEHGSDPDKIMESVRKSLIEELTPKIREEESQKLMARLDKKGKEVEGLGKVRGSSRVGDEKSNSGPVPLDHLFSH